MKSEGKSQRTKRGRQLRAIEGATTPEVDRATLKRGSAARGTSV